MPAVVLPTFPDDLARFGPDTVGVSDVAEAEAYCRRLATGHYENFPVATRLLPKDLRQPFCNVYAFCRWADDLGDEVPDADESLRLLAWWREELRECFAGRAIHPVFVALRQTIASHRLRPEPFEALISAFEQDQTATHYETMPQLLDYCARSAAPVGRIVLRLCGDDSPENVSLSDSVCTGLQLINFWQDVARDAGIGRRYLPADVMAAQGYTPEMWGRRETNAALTLMGEELVDDAATLLRAGEALAGRLASLRMRAVVGTFHRGGLIVAEKIRRNGFDLWRRPVVSKAELFGVVVRSALASVRGGV